MTKDEALKMPDLPRPYWNINGSFTKKQMIEYAKQACKEALAQPTAEQSSLVQKPKLWLDVNSDLTTTDPYEYSNKQFIPLYTTPPSREWVGLSDEEIEEVYEKVSAPMGERRIYEVHTLAKALDAKLKEKNNG